MKRILIWKHTSPGSEYDIFRPTNYETLYEHVQERWGGTCKNWGNRLWFQGIYSAIDTGENEYGFIADGLSPEEINSSYDMILLPMANIFYEGHTEALRELSEVFEKIKIPTFVVVCGVQADSYDALTNVISVIGEDSKRFIRAIYNTGGEFALRGFFTKEFFERLGFSSAIVTGCPSLYQMGPAFCVNDEKVELAELKPVFNGFVKPFENLLREYSQSVFIDQCDYFQPLFHGAYLANPNFKFQMEFVNRYGFQAANLLAEGRIAMIADMCDWWNYLRRSSFNYAFGSRIHGTIMALLSGIPATIVTFDSRTREMAEFFDIPYVLAKRKNSFDLETFHKLYEDADYTRFNQTFREKYSVFEKFLVEHGIVSHVNTHNHFLLDGEYRIISGTPEKRQQFELLAKSLDHNALRLKICNQGRRIAERIR